MQSKVIGETPPYMELPASDSIFPTLWPNRENVEQNVKKERKKRSLPPMVNVDSIQRCKVGIA